MAPTKEPERAVAALVPSTVAGPEELVLAPDPVAVPEPPPTTVVAVVKAVVGPPAVVEMLEPPDVEVVTAPDPVPFETTGVAWDGERPPPEETTSVNAEDDEAEAEADEAEPDEAELESSVLVDEEPDPDPPPVAVFVAEADDDLLELDTGASQERSNCGL